jgi:hypothetical protein
MQISSGLKDNHPSKRKMTELASHGIHAKKKNTSVDAFYEKEEEKIQDNSQLNSKPVVDINYLCGCTETYI